MRDSAQMQCFGASLLKELQIALSLGFDRVGGYLDFLWMLAPQCQIEMVSGLLSPILKLQDNPELFEIVANSYAGLLQKQLRRTHRLYLCANQLLLRV